MFVLKKYSNLTYFKILPSNYLNWAEFEHHNFTHNLEKFIKSRN
jgi:hypothetical protein